MHRLREKHWDRIIKRTERLEAYLDYIQENMPVLFLCEVKENTIDPPVKGEPGNHMYRQIMNHLTWGYTIGNRKESLRLKEWANKLGMQPKEFIVSLRNECRLTGKKGELLEPSIKGFIKNMMYGKYVNP